MESDEGDRVRLTVPATAAAARIARVSAAGLATRAGFSYGEVEQLRLAVDEATALLAGYAGERAANGTEEGRLAIVYVVERAGLEIELRVEGAGEGPDELDVPELARMILDASVDTWEVVPPERRITLHKSRAHHEDEDE